MPPKVTQSVSSVRNSTSALKNSNVKTKKEVPTAWRDRISPEDY
jgi:hypothetical protein